MYLDSAVLFGIIVMVTYGIQDYLIAHGSRKIGIFRNSIWFLSIQLLILIILGLFLFTYNNIQAVTIALVLFTGLIGTISLLSFSKGLIVGNISIVATIASGWGAITAILGVVVYKEILTSVQVLSIGLIVIGTIMVSFELRSIFNKRKFGRKRLSANYAILALFCYGIFFFMLSFLSKSIGWFDTAFLSTASTVVFMLGYGMLTRTSLRTSSSNFPILFVMAVLGLVGLFAYNIGTSSNYTSIIAPISAAAPVITVTLAIVLLREKLELTQKIGMIMVLIGLISLAI